MNFLQTLRFNKEILGCAIAMFLAGCSSNTNAPLPEIVRVDRVMPYHIVKEGESVGSIASQHSMTRTELIKLNGLSPPYQLYDGQRLVINVQVDNLTSSDTLQENHLPADSLNTLPASSQNISPHTAGYSLTNEEDTATIDSADLNDVPSVSVIDDDPQQAPSSSYEWPIAGGQSKIAQSFEDSSDGGIILQASAGTPVKSITDGIVKIARPLDGDAASYGKTVVVLHNHKDKLSIYSHLQELNVKAGQKIKKGDIIGKVGKSGNVKSPQLYFQIFDITNKKDKTRVAVDPKKILP